MAIEYGHCDWRTALSLHIASDGARVTYDAEATEIIARYADYARYATMPWNLRAHICHFLDARFFYCSMNSRLAGSLLTHAIHDEILFSFTSANARISARHADTLAVIFLCSLLFIEAHRLTPPSQICFSFFRRSMLGGIVVLSIFSSFIMFLMILPLF